MALSVGTQLGGYEILGPLGVGGMGEVYRARDPKLNRDVALKVLPESLAGNPDRLARFRREAQVLAALNHPNIAHIHGFEDSGTTHALVMELVEGPTLAERIVQGPIPLSEALPIARQIVDAVEAAHEQGIVHRDLKPANIKVRPDGTVKVLDFGLAKALDPPASSGADVMNSPTLTAHATKLGMIIGTAAYMAPEQARGKPVDRRADIWAFGVVLYEMLTGRRAFEGDDVSITLASVLKEDVSWGALPADIPAPVRRLLRRCLEKDPKRRLSAIGDARLELDDATSRPEEAAAAAAPARPASAAPRWRRALPWAVAATGVGAALLLLVLWSPWDSPPAPTARRLLGSTGADASLAGAAILSPDGATLAFVAWKGGITRLFIRKLDQLQAADLPGTDRASNPFFSPDGQWIAFFAGNKLKKTSVTGGTPVDLCDVAGNRGGAWADDGTIIFAAAPGAFTTTALMRVAATGGTPAAFATLGDGATTQRWPQALPGGKGVLYTEHSSRAGFDAANLIIAPLSSGTPKIVLRGGYYGRYVPSGPGASKRDERNGYLIYMQQGTLFAVRFDLDRLETVGRAVPAVEGLSANPGAGSAQLAFSSEGTLVYSPGAAAVATSGSTMDWMTRDGKTSLLRAAKANWLNARFSPDGKALAIEILGGTQSDIWVYEWARDRLTQLTFDPGQDVGPEWTPDGRRIVFASDRAKAGIGNLYWVNADGTGDVTRLTDSPENHRVGSWDPSGRFLTFNATRPATKRDVMILPMEGDGIRGWTPGKPTVFLDTAADEADPAFSPDGRWIAYSSEADLVHDVYVRPFPGPGGQRRITTEGDMIWPQWSATANDLLFLSLRSSPAKVMFSAYSVVGDAFRAEQVQPWSPTNVLGHPFDLHPDGKRIALVTAPAPVEGQAGIVQDKVVFVFNFFEYLKKLLPPGGG